MPRTKSGDVIHHLDGIMIQLDRRVHDLVLYEQYLHHCFSAIGVWTGPDCFRTVGVGGVTASASQRSWCNDAVSGVGRVEWAKFLLQCCPILKITASIGSHGGVLPCLELAKRGGPGSSSSAVRSSSSLHLLEVTAKCRSAWSWPSGKGQVRAPALPGPQAR